MTIASQPSPLSELRHELTALRVNWGWFVALGIVLIVLGIIALGSVVIASLAAAVAIGVLMLIGGLAETIGSFFARAWSGFFFHLLSGVLSVVVGVLFLRAPIGAMLALTLLLACLLLVGGIFKIIAVLSCRFSAWGWPLAGGIVDVILGLMIWREWPVSALWVIGMFLGINLIFRGFNWIGLGLALHARRPTEAPAPSARAAS